jgi:hypothetical protein
MPGHPLGGGPAFRVPRAGKDPVSAAGPGIICQGAVLRLVKAIQGSAWTGSQRRLKPRRWARGRVRARGQIIADLAVVAAAAWMPMLACRTPSTGHRLRPLFQALIGPSRKC